MRADTYVPHITSVHDQFLPTTRLKRKVHRLLSLRPEFFDEQNLPSYIESHYVSSLVEHLKELHEKINDGTLILTEPLERLIKDAEHLVATYSPKYASGHDEIEPFPEIKEPKSYLATQKQTKTLDAIFKVLGKLEQLEEIILDDNYRSLPDHCRAKLDEINRAGFEGLMPHLHELILARQKEGGSFGRQLIVVGHKMLYTHPEPVAVYFMHRGLHYMIHEGFYTEACVTELTELLVSGECCETAYLNEWRKVFESR